MLFFGLCLGDSGYGLFMLLAVTLYRLFAKKLSASMKPILTLVQILGASTMVCGLLTGTCFGFNLYDIQVPFFQTLKETISLDNQQMFNLSLILGGVQIIFGMILKAVNQTIQFGVTIGYLPQVMILSDKHTVMEEAEMAFEHIFELQASIERMNQELADRTDYDSENYHKLIEKFTHDNERFLMMGGTNYTAEIERTLMGLGFSREDFNRPTSEFSGGWRMRIELAKLLLRRPDVLLLDEPTNHLDIESIQWLENFLKTSAGAVVLVSHDRAFINNVTNRTIEISCGHIYDYKVAYDEFVVLRKERREQQLRAYENQQKQIQDTEDFIERFRYKATKAV